MKIEKDKVKDFMGKSIVWIRTQVRITMRQLLPFAKAWYNWVLAIRDLLRKDKDASAVHFKSGIRNAKQSMRIFLLIVIVCFACRDVDDSKCSIGGCLGYKPCQILDDHHGGTCQYYQNEEELEKRRRDSGDNKGGKRFSEEIQKLGKGAIFVNRSTAGKIIRVFLEDVVRCYDKDYIVGCKIDDLKISDIKIDIDDDNEVVSFESVARLCIPDGRYYESNYSYNGTCMRIENFEKSEIINDACISNLNQRIGRWNDHHKLYIVCPMRPSQVRDATSSLVDFQIKRNSKGKWFLVPSERSYTAFFVACGSIFSEKALKDYRTILNEGYPDESAKVCDRYCEYYRKCVAHIEDLIAEIHLTIRNSVTLEDDVKYSEYMSALHKAYTSYSQAELIIKCGDKSQFYQDEYRVSKENYEKAEWVAAEYKQKQMPRYRKTLNLSIDALINALGDKMIEPDDFE